MATIRNLSVASRVLVYLDPADGNYVAHALEMDLIGFGDSPNKALADLKNAIEAQISFAVQKSALPSLFHPAPKAEVERWQKANGAALADLAKGDATLNVTCRATVIEIGPDDLRRIVQRAASKPFEKQARGGAACCHA